MGGVGWGGVGWGGVGWGGVGWGGVGWGGVGWGGVGCLFLYLELTSAVICNRKLKSNEITFEHVG